MIPIDHEKYATGLMSSIQGAGITSATSAYRADPEKKRNAANAVKSILCHRISDNSGDAPVKRDGTTYEWKNGTFNCRNITDRVGVFWTNLESVTASNMRDAACNMPAAYLFTCSAASGAEIGAWAIPEPVLHLALGGLDLHDTRRTYAIEITVATQRIKKCHSSPDLTPYYRKFRLQSTEMKLLEESRKADALAKSLDRAAKRLNRGSVFDPNSIVDARKRVLMSIARRRGQPEFRRRLLRAYGGHCAI